MYLGCIDEEFGVGSYALYLSTSLFVFLALLLFKPGIQYLFLTPMFIIMWMLLSELVLIFFKIPIIHVVPMEGDIRVMHSQYFQFNIGNWLAIFFIFYTSFFSGLIAYRIAPIIRKFFTGTLSEIISRSIMNGKIRSFFKITALAIILVLLAPLPIIYSLGTTFRNDVIWYYLLLALPFLGYLLIGWTKKIHGKKSAPLILIMAPIISVAFSSVYIALEGATGYQFGALPIIMLMAGIHFLLGILLSVIFYFTAD